MILTSVEATNNRGAILSLPLEDVSVGFVVKNIDGLGPVKATLVSSSFANLDGQQYQSSRREARNIKIQLGLNPDYGFSSVYDLRSQLYNFFMPKTSTLLRFSLFDRFAESEAAANLNVFIDGRIESCEPTIFAKQPATDISIMCFNPDFYDPNLIVLTGLTVATMVETPVPYAGTVDTGVLFTLSLDRNLDSFTIYHKTPENVLRITDVAYPFLAGDVVKISSVPGAKSVLLTRAGVETSILYAVTPESNWVELQPGDNTLRVYAVGAGVPYSVEYNNKYGGL